MEILNKSTALLYALSSICVDLSDVILHESKVIEHKNTGKFQHRAEKLKAAHKNMFSVMELNIDEESMNEIKKCIEIVMDKLWES